MAADTETKTSQYLSFKLDEEVFALDIWKVREVLEFRSLTKVPQTPPFMKGVINLRGGVIPIIDLKLKFRMHETVKTINTCVIISEVSLGEESVVLGLLADEVDEVFDLSDKDIEPAPRIGTRLNTEFLKGMGKKDEEFILILDIDKVFSVSDLDLASAMAEHGETVSASKAD